MANFINNPSQQNYYFKRNNAYTEDHVVVKKLFLYNVPPELMPQEVEIYFGGYGRVTRVQLFKGKGGSNQQEPDPLTPPRHHWKTGFVQFECSRDAARALRHNRHTVLGKSFSVQANDSWHQPDAYGTPSDENSPPAVIMKLNDHCMQHVVRQLTFVDRIHFARTCNRFRCVYQDISGALNRSVRFDVFDSMTVWDMRDYFMLSGQHIKHIEGIIPPGRCQRLCEFFGVHCANLITMRVTASKLTLRNMHKLFVQLNNLQELKLRACGLSNASLLALKHLDKLKHLDISDNNQLTGLNMNCLPDSLEYLNIACCNGFLSKYLQKLCRALPLLKELNLKAVYTITTGFQQLVSTRCCPQLEHLTLSGGPLNEYEYIAKLPALKKIVLYSYEQGTTLRSDLLNWLVDHKAKKLEHFEARGQNSINGRMISQIGQLTALRTLMLPHNSNVGDRDLEALRLQHLQEINLKYWPNLTNNAVLHLILTCPKLNLLYLEECPELTEKLLHDIIYKLRVQLRDKDNKRKLPIRMHVYGTKINECSLKHKDVAAKDIIDATLEPPASSDLCLVRMTNMMEFDFHLDDYDSFGSDDELDPDYDRYMYNVGFLSDDDHQCDDMIFNDDDLFEINMDNAADLFEESHEELAEAPQNE